MLRADFSNRKALFCLVHGALCVVTIGTLTMLTGMPFLFPALGGSAFMLLFMPQVLPSAPRSVVLGHMLGASIGWASAQLCGLDFERATLLHGGGAIHVAAAALALGSTSALMILLRAPHPPAGATTLLFALGQITPWWCILVVGFGGLLLTLQMGCVYRFAGQSYPLWRAESSIALPMPETAPPARD